MGVFGLLAAPYPRPGRAFLFVVSIAFLWFSTPEELPWRETGGSAGAYFCFAILLISINSWLRRSPILGSAGPSCL
jgi:hypothetical protein